MSLIYNKFENPQFTIVNGQPILCSHISRNSLLHNNLFRFCHHKLIATTNCIFDDSSQLIICDFWNKLRLFDNVECCSVLLCALENLFLSAACIVTILHVNFSGFGFGVVFATLIFFVLLYIKHQIIYPVWVSPEARFCFALPSQYGLPYEELELETADGERLAAYLVLQEHSVRAHIPTILFCHGNAGNIGPLLLNVVQMHKFCLVKVLIFDYRGYGRSSGRSTEFGFPVRSSRLDSIALKSNQRRSGVLGQDGGPHSIPKPSEIGNLFFLSNTFSRIIS